MCDFKRRPTVIGLCGRSGSGKGYLCDVFLELGVPSVDTDAVYRKLTSPSDTGEPRECTQALAREFGREILSEDGSLNRRALAAIVFAQGAQEMLKRLNFITHAYILAETDRLVDEYGRQGAAAVVVDAPVLFESGYHKKCDCILAAVAPEEVILRRIVDRDGITVEAAQARLAAQRSSEDLASLADFVIETDAPRECLVSRVRELLGRLSEKGLKDVKI